MKGNWAAWAIKHREVVYFFAALVALMGIFSYIKVGRQEDPGFGVKTMVVTAAWPGASAKQVEMHVTDPLEKVIQNVQHVDIIKSRSQDGVCVITVELQDTVPQADLSRHWQDIRNLVADAQKKGKFPTGLYGPYFDDHFDDVYGNIFAVTSDAFSYEDMRKVAEDIKNQFIHLRYVQKVELIGVQPEKIYLQVNNDKLAQLGISLDALMQAIGGETTVTPGGMLHDGDSNTYLRLTGLPTSVEDIENLPVSGGGRTLRLGDIATVQRAYADPPESKMYFNGKPAVGIALSMEDGGNNLELGESLDAKLAEIHRYLPLGFELHKVTDQPSVVRASVNEFMEGLLEAILIVLVVSLMSLGRRSGYVISVCIPLVLMCSFVGMYLFGFDMHKVTLGALIVSLGMLVDDSIVVIEMIELKVNEGWDRVKACSYAFQSCAKPLLTGTMITVAAFMPIAFAKGDVGDYAGSLFFVIGVTLMSSWLVSATVAPTLSYEWIVPTRVDGDGHADGMESDAYAGGFYTAFRKLLHYALHHRVTVVCIALAALASVALLGRTLQQEFFPESTRPELLIDINLPGGSSFEKTDVTAQAITNMLLADESVVNVSTHVGESIPRFVLVMDPEQPRANFAQIVAICKDIDSRLALQHKVNTLVEQRFPDVQCYSRGVPLGPPSPYPVMLRVSAPTDELAKEYAAKVKALMLQNKKITLIRYDWMEKSRTVKLEMDNDKLLQLGLTRRTVASALQAELSGYAMGSYYEGDQQMDLTFRVDPADRQDVDALGAMTIPTAKGTVQLNQVAHIRYENEDAFIYRRNLLPTVTVNAGVIPGVTGNDVTAELWAASADLRRNLPHGVTIEIGGPTEESATANAYILEPVPAMLVIILVLLMLQVQSLKKLFIIVCTAPFGLVGVVLGLFLFNTPLGVMAEVGALALTGTIIRNSTVLVDQIDQHLAEGMTPYRAVTTSVIVRFRPIMLTALTTVLGLIPMFPSAFWRGMAIALSAGLTVATLITLVLLPVLYCMVYKVQNEG